MSKTTSQPTPSKVLIIEDEGDMCLLLNIMLNGTEIDLDHVKTLASAEEYLQNEKPAVIILDNKLPDGFGMDFLPFLKSNHPAVKIIMITGYDASAQDAALESGADIFLEKPFTREQLYTAIKTLLDTQPVEG
jgi:two-component system, OmpR family, response regulator